MAWIACSVRLTSLNGPIGWSGSRGPGRRRRRSTWGDNDGGASRHLDGLGTRDAPIPPASARRRRRARGALLRAELLASSFPTCGRRRVTTTGRRSTSAMAANVSARFARCSVASPRSWSPKREPPSATTVSDPCWPRASVPGAEAPLAADAPGRSDERGLLRRDAAGLQDLLDRRLADLLQAVRDPQGRLVEVDEPRRSIGVRSARGRRPRRSIVSRSSSICWSP